MKKLTLISAALALFATAALAGGLYTNGLPVATSITGNETIPADTNLPSGLNPQTEAITVNQLSAAVNNDVTYTAIANTTSFTLTAAQVTGSGKGGFVVLNMTGALAAGATATTPTAALWIAAMPSAVPGAVYTIRVINNSSGAFAWTVAGGTGVTVTGTATIAQNTFRDYAVTVNAAGAGTVTLQNVGSGTN